MRGEVKRLRFVNMCEMYKVELVAWPAKQSFLDNVWEYRYQCNRPVKPLPRELLERVKTAWPTSVQRKERQVSG